MKTGFRLNALIPALSILVLIIICHAYRPRSGAATLTIQFRAYVHGAPLVLNKRYLSPFGEPYEISRFRFYAGHITLVYVDSLTRADFPTDYHLVDFSDSGSTRFNLPVKEGAFKGIGFQLGVDSSDQNQGAQTGALDPIHGMFWTWNSGYQSFKLEGTSPLSNQPAHLIAYHIGGYQIPNSTIWKIRMFTTNDELIQLSKESNCVIEVPVELDYFFDGPHPLYIRNTPACTTPGEMARQISENFIGAFTGLTINPGR